MPEPTGGEPHPYADIIDLFREADAEPAAPAAAPVPDAAQAGVTVTPVTAPTPATKPAPSVPRRPRTPTVATQLPSRSRRAAMLLPVALLALAGGATVAVIHRHDDRHDDRHADRAVSSDASSPSTPATTATLPGTGASPAQGVSRAAASVTQEYSRALDQLTAVQGADDLATAARRLGARTAELHAATGPLARAEAAHLDALVALSTLDSGTTDGLTSYARLAKAATSSSAAVAKAAGGREDVPDPSVATGNVVALSGAAVVDGLGTRLGRLADATADADLTAQLRIAAAQAQALVPAATSAAATITDPSTAARADAYARALRALAALQVIDGDHLTSWASLAGPLQEGLSAAGVSGASDDVHAVAAMVSAAQRKMDAWAAKSGEAVPLGSATPASQTPAQERAQERAAHAAVEAAQSYASRADDLVARYAQAIAALPLVAPGQQPSFDLATRFHAVSRLFDGLTATVAGLRPPTGMAGAQETVADLVARGRAAAVAGEEMALDASDCDPTRRACVMGAMTEWPSYKRAVGALGSPGTVRAAITQGVDAAKAAAAAAATASVPSGGATAHGRPPKPIV